MSEIIIFAMCDSCGNDKDLYENEFHCDKCLISVWKKRDYSPEQYGRLQQIRQRSPHLFD